MATSAVGKYSFDVSRADIAAVGAASASGARRLRHRVLASSAIARADRLTFGRAAADRADHRLPR